MQPDSNQVAPGELPRPQYEPMPAPVSAEPFAAAPEAVEAQAIEQGSSLPPAPATPPVYNLPIADDASVAPQTPSSQASPLSPQIADDADLIEKEWVTKAKQIVEQTKADPYTQTKEMNKMKADYLKKRYAKDLRLPEE